ncbi:MAG: LemA family protein [Clostridia bacterium]
MNNKNGKVGMIILICVIAVIVIVFIWGLSINNSLIGAKETIRQNQAEIDNQLKRRADLIPNLVNSVKGVASQEQKIVDSVTSARANMVKGDTQDRLNANADLTKNVNLIVENYPEIKSDKAFVSLMDELSETENKIAYANKKYNDEVASYNKKNKTFPNSMIAGMFNHEESKYLEVTETQKELPEVKF